MVPSRRRDVALGPPDARGRASRSPKGRSCSEPSCTTILSTYNPSPTCYLHTQPTYRHPLARD
jgi:hypothetical protein